LLESCECDNTHEQNDTVCRYCWAYGRRKPGDPEVQLFEVPVIYRGQCSFLVRATSKEQAGEKATFKFKNGDCADELGNEWEEIDRLGDISPVDTGEES
jgi:hypothetical protein